MISYKTAGVNIEAGDSLVENIKPIAAGTKRPGVMGSIGGFGALFDLKACGYKDPIFVSSTDGIGTKIHVAVELNNYKSIGQDLVAMSVNDIITQGAEPLFFLDYFAVGRLDVKVATQVVESVAKACTESNCALIGGETAEMPTMYQGKDFDMAGFAVGACERGSVLPKTNEMKPSDVLIALPSAGVHSNGFSLVHHILKKAKIELSYRNNELFGDKTLGETLLTPTKIYVKDVMPLIKAGLLKGLAHITGGGIYGNITRVLPSSLTPNVDKKLIKVPEIFKFLQEVGKVETSEMYSVFNMGVGMMLVCAKENEAEVLQVLRKGQCNAYTCGVLKEKT